MSGWIKLAAYICAYEWLHRRDSGLLSEEADRFIARRPIVARVTIWGTGMALTAHVANCLPWQVDILSQRFWRQFF